jgi:hypothetical protein
MELALQGLGVKHPQHAAFEVGEKKLNKGLGINKTFSCPCRLKIIINSLLRGNFVVST